MKMKIPAIIRTRIIPEITANESMIIIGEEGHIYSDYNFRLNVSLLLIEANHERLNKYINN